ncbi:nuclear mRNA export, poly(A)+RNA binding protein [Fusarium torreyae]|uniref:Nuclear mRNA export, poly(A)+RNA binding protein n=1 Tax=Fusarium torreyae TaxID=1237075 RepID=A0A9W8SHS6_9HYPO|nr:nuclear mRNA export, poly(A)+RNA binding protein [Fusarium torreyae]
MAPRGKQSTSGRETRNAARKSNTTSRGGISKRKAGRIDGDGDLDMDSAGRRAKKTATADTKPGRSGTRASTRGGPSKNAQNVLKHLSNGTASSLASRISSASSGKGPKTRSQDMTGLKMLRVGGLKESKAATNPGGGLNDLLGFMERKAGSFRTGSKRRVAIKKSHYVGDYVYVGASEEDAEELIKLNTFTFAGAPLEVIRVDEIPERGRAVESKETQELRTKLQEILSARYLGDNKLLKLDTLASDVELVTLGMFENRERALKTFKGLMAICDGLFKTAKEKQDAIESISLASNNIDDVAQVEVVATTFPHLKNLDMSGNQVASIQALQPWKGKFRHLETIYMTGNPIEAADPNYPATLLEWFPKLQNINGIQLRTPEQIAEQEAALRPKPIPQNGPDFRDVGGVGENFLLEFFASYDNDRPGLASRFYDEDSQFSVSVDTQSARDPNAPAPMAWGSYIKLSRNLTKINSPNARIQRLFHGANSIQDAWKTLPLTRHPDIKQEISKYIMDCHPLQGLVDPSGQSSGGVDGLIIAVHGEFEEHDPNTNTTGKRSFSRTFILGPAKPGRGMIRVVSDMLSLRAFSLLPNVFAASAPTPAPASADQHQAMIAELSKQTGMTAQYSEMCLTQVNWEFDKALVIFNEKKVYDSYFHR